MIGSIAGLKMIESVHAQEQDGKRGTYVKRSMIERLFSLPWRPFRKDKLMIVQNYKPAMYLMHDRLIYHPSLSESIFSQVKNVS